MRPPFVVTGTPRSRTTWLSRFLSWADTCCLHEPSMAFRDLGDLDRFLSGKNAAASDSAMTLLWREIVARRPDTVFVVVRRPLDEVRASARRVGVAGPGVEAMLERVSAAADLISARSGTLSVTFADLQREEVCAEVFRHGLGETMPSAWWRYWAPLRIECDVAGQLERIRANAKGLTTVYGPHLR